MSDSIDNQEHVVNAFGRSYSVVVWYEEETGLYNVDIPAFAPDTTCGDSVEHALDMACDLIGLLIEYKLDHGQPVPVEDAPAEEHTIQV